MITYASATQTFAGVRAVINVIAGISSAFFGTASGTDEAGPDGGRFTGGTPDRITRFRITVADDCWIAAAAAAPGNTSLVRTLVTSGAPWTGHVDQSQNVYIRRRGSANVDYGAEMWRI